MTGGRIWVRKEPIARLNFECLHASGNDGLEPQGAAKEPRVRALGLYQVHAAAAQGDGTESWEAAYRGPPRAPETQGSRLSHAKGKARALRAGEQQGTDASLRDRDQRELGSVQKRLRPSRKTERPPLVQKGGRLAPKHEKISEVWLGFVLRLYRKESPDPILQILEINGELALPPRPSPGPAQSLH